ncbi:PhzF family phenazine biosynthesis protein [Saccharopolyspora spinosporotrichia]
MAELRDPVPFALVDVFGSSPLSGNPLAVVDACELGGEGPPPRWMRQVAREMNQAETTFVLPAGSGERTGGCARSPRVVWRCSARATTRWARGGGCWPPAGCRVPTTG